MGPASGRVPPLPDDALARIDTLDHRLAAIERWAGMRPDLDELDQEIALVCREKEAAIDRQDFEAAAAHARQGEATTRRPGRPGEGVDAGRC